MKIGIALAVCVSLAIAGPFGCRSTNVQSQKSSQGLPGINVERQTQCLPRESFSVAIKTLSSSNTPYEEVDHARRLLMDTSRISDPCKKEVISTLMDAMDKPNLDFKRDESSYLLWRYGADMLGELKAVEALDLLISHLDLATATFSTSMNHQPALQGVIKMGSIALPKLGDAVQHNPNPKIRSSAVYCLALIGGNLAVAELKSALNSESDECIKRLIQVSLDSFDERGTIQNQAAWLSRFTCN